MYFPEFQRGLENRASGGPKDAWEEMLMLGEWRGLAAAAMAMATVDGAEEMHVVDESHCQGMILKIYDGDGDGECHALKDVVEAEVLRGAEYSTHGGRRWKGGRGEWWRLM